MYDPVKTAAANQRLIDNLTSGNEKQAASDVDSYTKIRVREEGQARKVLPWRPAYNSMLTPQVYAYGGRSAYEDLIILEELERDSPGAVSGDLNGLPESMEIFGNVYMVRLAPWMGVKWYKNVDKLRNYKTDLRQVCADQQIRDLSDAEDAAFFSASRSAAGTLDTVNPNSGVIQWQTIHDGITRESEQDGFKVLFNTPTHAQTKTVVLNVNTGREYLKWRRDEVGGDLAQEQLISGKFMVERGGVTYIGTIKTNIVPDGRVHHYAPDDFIGKAYELEQPTMYMKKEYFNVEFQLKAISGFTIANTNSCAILEYSGV